LVDDDQDGPDVRAYYTSTLDALNVTYAVWDVVTQSDPSASDLTGYEMVLWFTGYPRSSTFTSANETAVAAYLDAEGRFFLSSEDYLHDRGLTSFGRDRLRINSYTNDVNRTDPEGTGSPPGGGLGPYNLTLPDGWPGGDLYTDNVVKWSG
jgi:gamma-glutamyltranspeptidase